MSTHRVAWIGGIHSERSPEKLRGNLPANCELVGVCDIREDAIAAIRDHHPDLLATTDFHDIAAMDGCDSVISFTPNETHRDIAVACLEGGKHVFIEKPMGITLEQGREILEAERASGKYVAVDLEFRASRIGRAVKEVIDSGEIGDLVEVECDHHRGGWLDDTPQGRYRTKRRTSGLFKMEGIHMIDLMRFWAGEIERCQVFSSPNVLPHYEFCDNCTVMVDFAEGVRGRFTASHTKVSYSVGNDLDKATDLGHMHRMSVLGTKGGMLIDFWTARVDVLHLVAQPAGTNSLKPEFARRIDFSGLPNPMAAGHDMGGCRSEFLRRMAAGEPPYQSAEDAYRSEQIAYALDDCRDRTGGVIDCTAW